MFALSLMTVALAVQPVPTGRKAPEPVATLTTAPIEVIEKSVLSLIRTVAGPEGEKIEGEFKGEVAKILGPGGWDGINVKKPCTGYLIFNEKEPSKSYGFLVIPVTDEKKFLAILERLGKSGNPENKLTPVPGHEGLYKLDGPHKDEPDQHVRVVNGYAYFGMNAPVEAFAPSVLIPADKTIDAKETAKVAVAFHISRLPKNLVADGLKWVEQTAGEGLNNLPKDSPAVVRVAGEKGIAFFKRTAQSVLSDGDVTGMRLFADGADLGIEYFLSGKSGSTLATDIASRKPTANRYAGIVTDDAVGGAVIRLPFFAEEIRTIASTALTESIRELSVKDPPPAEIKDLVAQSVSRLSETIKSGEFDLGAALVGPDARGSYTAVLGISLTDAVGLTPEIKKLIMAKAEGIVEWDVADVGGVKIHSANIGPLLPPEAKKIFSGSATCHFALTKSGVILSLGRESLAQVKRCVALQSKAAPVVDVKINPAKLGKIVGLFDPQAGQIMAELYGKDDALKSSWALHVESGAELKVRYSMNAALFSRSMGVARGGPAPPAPAGRPGRVPPPPAPPK